MNDKYLDIVDKHTPKEDRLKNAIVTFVAGGIIGSLSELLLRYYMLWFDLPRKEAGVVVILTLIILASLLTAFGVFDVCVMKLKSALIIPITGFAHSMTAAALEYRKEGLVLGIGANIFKLAGTVILYGIVSVYIFGLIRLLVMGGKMTTKFNNVYVGNTYTIASVYEKDGPIADYFDLVYDKDLYYGCDTFEKAEEKILHDSIERLIDKVNLKDSDIDYVISGDLQNQIAASDYAMRNFNIPFLGIFNACATFGEGLLIGANFIEGKRANNIIVSTSSHNMVAEKQFRNPTEYGAPKKKTTTWTSTGAASMLITNKKGKIKITSATAGRVQDKNITDVNNMGAVMAIAAADTIERHFKDLKIKPNDYDLILTGDLGCYGKEILIDYLKTKNIDISKNYDDCGLILYDINKQSVFAGASGPASSALVLCSYILKEMERGKYKKVLIVPTGAIFSPTWVFQKESIPSIAHAISLEVCE